MPLRSDSFDDDADKIAARLKELIAPPPGRGLPYWVAGAAAVSALLLGLAAGRSFLAGPSSWPELQAALKDAKAEAADALKTKNEAGDKYRAAAAELTRLQAAKDAADDARKQAEANYGAVLRERDRALAAKEAAEASAKTLAAQLKEAQAGFDKDEARIVNLTVQLKSLEKQLAEAAAALRTAERDAANAKAELVKLRAAQPDERPAPPPAERAPKPLTVAEAAAFARNPGQSFKECVNCPEMVVIPEGSFTMGSSTSEEGRSNDEGPQHEVRIAKPFAVGKFDVTFDEWGTCVSGGGCTGNRSPSDAGWGRGLRPVINVSWDDAQQYVTWLNGKVRGQPYRLLTEAEWEYAARAGTQTRYYWGDQIGKNRANCDGCGSQWDNKQTAPVGSFAPNAFGLHDMAGNVWQWTEDCWNENYHNAPADGSVRATGDCSRRVLRGGSWDDDPQNLRSADRNWNPADFRISDSGFRLARTLN